MGKYECFSFNMSLDSNAKEVSGRLGDLSRKANLVMSRAINRTTGHVRTRMTEEVVKRYQVKTRKVQGTISVSKKATAGDPSARIISIGAHPNLISFKVKQSSSWKKLKPSNKRVPKFYLANVMKNSGWKPLAGNPKPFVMQPKNGGIAVFRRLTAHEKPKSKSEYGITGVGGPAIPQMIKNKNIMSVVNEDANDMMAKRLDHEIDLILKKGR